MRKIDEIANRFDKYGVPSDMAHMNCGLEIDSDEVEWLINRVRRLEGALSKYRSTILPMDLGGDVARKALEEDNE